MYELWHLLTAYFVGTTAGVILFKTYVKESIIVSVLDNLVDQGFVKSFVDDQGTIQFMTIQEIEQESEILARVMNQIDEYEKERENNEKDDTA